MGVTLDGFVHSAKGYEDWGIPPEEDEVVASKVASLREAGKHLIGRLTYEAMAAVWPNTTGVYADVMNEIPKVVFSSTPSGGSGCCSTTVNLTRTRDRGAIGHARRHFVHVDVTGRIR
jgi:RibD C-terminal domain